MRRLLMALLGAMLTAGSAAAQFHYTWANVDQSGGFSYWNFGTNAEAWTINNVLGTGYPGDTSTSDTATFGPKVTNAINPIVNPDPSQGNQPFYAFASLSVDNTETASGWTFNLYQNTPVSLNLHSTGTALTITGSGNTVTFHNGFGVSANGQTWSIGGNTVFNGTVALGTNDLTMSLGNATATIGTAMTTSGGKLSLVGNGTLAASANVNLVLDGTVNPGSTPNSIGTLSLSTSGTGSTTIDGIYQFDLSAAGTGGVAFNSGASGGVHDLVQLHGSANLSGLQLDIQSLGTTGFDNALAYSWLVMSVTDGTLSGTPTLNSILGTDFSNTGGGVFTVNVLGNHVFLNFTPVPEPTGWLAAITASLALAGRLRPRQPRGIVS
jgi:hypothetical protein